MNNGPSIWNLPPSTEQPPPSSDPTLVWIHVLFNHGGFLSLIGTPAILAFLAFVFRIRWLHRHRQPHGFGRTALIYWPSQILITLSLLPLLSLLLLFNGHSSESHGLVPAAILMLAAWSTGLVLNKNEHKYEIRSSDLLFLFYLITLLTSSIGLYILKTLLEVGGQLPEGLFVPAYRSLGWFVVMIGLAFVVEAWPRTQTRVQIESRQRDHMTAKEQANFFSRITYHWMQGIVTLGATRPLKGEDLDNTTSDDLRSHVNYERVQAFWERELAKSKNSGKTPSLMLANFRAFRGRIAFLMTWRVAGLLLGYLPSVMLGQLLQFFSDYANAKRDGTEPPSVKVGLLIAIAMMASNVSATLIFTNSMEGVIDLGIATRAAAVTMIYRKALQLSPAARQKSTLGEITNHMAVDADKWIQAANFMPFLITTPFELALGLYLLSRQLGWALASGFTVFMIIAPLQTRLAAFMTGFQETKLEFMDARLRLMSEILSNIKIVKLYGWEDAFRAKINDVRTKELHAEKMLATIRALLTIVFSSVTLLMGLASFSAFAYIGGPGFTPGKLTPQVVFVSISLFSMLSRPLGMITHMVRQTIAVQVANRRIQGFLLLEEIDTTMVERLPRPTVARVGSKKRKEEFSVIEIQGATFAWAKEEKPDAALENESNDPKKNIGERQPLLSGSSSSVATPLRPILSDINLSIPDGSLTTIVGRIGQGKSSLLSAIMGEMYKKQGTVRVFGDLAIVPQQAWIINATVKDNILFGKPFDQELYSRVIFCAGLAPDLEMLAAGDQTEIGERGINLSGGQKQRVSLARAAYQDADIYLLDDPLSAVDAHVDQHLWQHLIGPEGMLKNKTRVLVTHGIHHLEHVDKIVVLKDGLISESGDYLHLMKAKGAFYQLIRDFSAVEKKKKHDNGSSEDSTADDEDRKTVVAEVEEVKKDGEDENTGELIESESMAEGKVTMKTTLAYVKAMSYHKFLFCCLFFAVGQCAHVGTNLWLRFWISESDARDHDGGAPRPISYYLSGYAALVLVFLMCDIGVNYVTEVVCGIQAATTLHNRLLTRVLHLPMSFFDTTPMGRIVNRFSGDMEAVDSSLPEECNDLMAFVTMIIVSLLVISYSTPAFLFMVPPLAFAYYLIQDYFIKTSGSLKRLYSVSKSPLYQHFSETLSGVATIRVTRGLRERFIEQNEVKADTIVNRVSNYVLLNRWLQIRLEFMGASVVFATSALAVLTADKLDPSMVGLALSYALSIINFLNYLVRTVSEVSNLLVSVERIEEYSHKPTEAPAITGVRPPANWPQHGKVVFKDYSARYRLGLDLVIKDVSFTVQPTESIGIVGRTGAGKSSLTLALFRIIEAADSYWAIRSDPSNTSESFLGDIQENVNPLLANHDGGSIEIDGIDISTIGLQDLRRHLAIIPQDPTLFAGSVRANLDPFDELQDADLWQALERAHLRDYIATLPGGLAFEVAQNGDNFSVGQRSLICLARALLRKTKVLILDEATAAVDVETDDLIQKTIRSEFKDRTVLTIAHRIKTVMDSDKILVLEKGRVQEFESPNKLLERKSSLFYNLAHQAGEI
ncbi:ATP-binding cassette, subfamily C (CFTR/MRP), member 1 [Entomortierella parvispora]|uniref:ATP-binding cassette, subfamily C (CFTR/MRP), member 1 n=1 Tax=Entomortierella parvispora TaxID=205924 RepID=A0A9P3HCF8_9FUNG|nr:ATP-binding cassette, subfamily C (CFTR/MRP), member 1 [Entomortierella parvispora]